MRNSPWFPPHWQPKRTGPSRIMRSCALIETLGFRHIGVVQDEYAVSRDGMKMFGVLDLETEMDGCRFSIGVRNAHDKSMRLAMTLAIGSSFAATWRSVATLRRCSPSTRNRSP